MTDQTPATAPVTAQDIPGGPGLPTGGPKPPQTALQRLHRLRGQLAAEHAKAVAADRQPRPDLDHLRVTAPNGMAVGLEVAIFFADHHLREAGEEARTTPDNSATSGDAADNCCVCGGGPVVYRNFLERPFCSGCADCQCGENPCVRTGINDPAVSGDARLRQESEAWRRKAIRRALGISKLQGTIHAVTDLASEEITARTEWGDGYRAAIVDLQEVLREFGQIDQPAKASSGKWLHAGTRDLSIPDQTQEQP